jgi:hypothetical protein
MIGPDVPFLTPGMDPMSPTWGSSIPLLSSLSLPLRRTIATSEWPEDPSVRVTPSLSISADASTNTTSAMPMEVAAVVVLRTERLRRL